MNLNVFAYGSRRYMFVYNSHYVRMREQCTHIENNIISFIRCVGGYLHLCWNFHFCMNMKVNATHSQR